MACCLTEKKHWCSANGQHEDVQWKHYFWYSSASLKHQF